MYVLIYNNKIKSAIYIPNQMKIFNRLLLKCYIVPGAQERSVIDCRTKGCGKNGECLREGAEFICRCIPGTEGDADIECHTSEYLFTYLLTPCINAHNYKEYFLDLYLNGYY